MHLAHLFPCSVSAINKKFLNSTRGEKLAPQKANSGVLKSPP